MTPNHKQFEDELRNAAEAALSALPEQARVEVALKAVLGIEKAGLAGSLLMAANRIREHSEILVREAFDRECG